MARLSVRGEGEVRWRVRVRWRPKRGVEVREQVGDVGVRERVKWGWGVGAVIGGLIVLDIEGLVMEDGGMRLEGSELLMFVRVRD